MINILSYISISIGLIFLLWGTLYLLRRRSVLYKLHSLSVADTLGAILIILGLLFKLPSFWAPLLLAILSLALWNTMLGYVLAYCSTPTKNDDD